MVAVKMNSFTNPPMAKSQKFQFEVDFDLEEERLRTEEATREAEKRRAMHDLEESAKPLSYSDEEMTREKDTAYRKGMAEGEAKPKQSLEQILADALIRATKDLEALTEKETAREKEAHEIALTMTLSAIKKAWPQIVQSLGQGLVEDTIRQSLELNPNESRIVVRVHDSILDAIVDRLPHIKDGAAFAGKVIVLADDSVAAGDCKVEWADGGLERLSRTLSQQLDDAVTRVLSRLTAIQPKDDKIETERTTP
jgi:flagellar assembly protein FliH